MITMRRRMIPAGFISIALWILMIIAPPVSLAAPIQNIFADTSDGLGYEAVVSYGPDWDNTGREYALASISGDVESVNALSVFERDFRFPGFGFGGFISPTLTYTLVAEAFAFEGATISADALVEFIDRDTGNRLFADMLSIFYPGAPGSSNELLERIDMTNRERITDPTYFDEWSFGTVGGVFNPALNNLPINRTYRMKLTSSVWSSTRFDPPEAFFSASAFVDPILSVPVNYLTNPEEQITQSSFGTVIWPGGSGNDLPEPAALALMLLGLLGLGVRRYIS